MVSGWCDWRVTGVPGNGDLVDGVLEGLAETELALGDAALFKHGPNCAIHFLLHRSGSRTALVTTQGFRDLIEIGRSDRTVPFQVNYRRDPQLVPRNQRFELLRRIGQYGELVTSSEAVAVEALCVELQGAGQWRARCRFSTPTPVGADLEMSHRADDLVSHLDVFQS